jgi:hypothetical protein
MLDGLSLDPHTVLGVPRGASAEQLRDAYHQKSKKYHPDLGGDDWAFRIVVRAYEILSHAAPAESPTLGAASGPAVTPQEPADTGRIRPGVQDKGVDPTRLVHVEMLWMRYEVGDFVELLTERPEDRNLSGSLTLTWPDPALAPRAAMIPQADRILRALNAAFDEARARPEVRGARSHIDGGRFEAWLGYPNGHAAWLAFKNLHVGLKARGLGVKQWTRDLIVPREGRDA